MLYTNKDTFVVSAPSCMDTEPDSLEAIIAGNEAGANGCAMELDVTGDGIVVLCGHGGFILADGSSVALSDCTFGEVRAAFPKIITIGQAVELAKSCVAKICIHLKSTAICPHIKLALGHADYIDSAYFVGLSLTDAARLAKTQPTLHFMADILESPEHENALIRTAQDAGLFGIRVAPAVLTKSLCDEAHRVGLFVATTECHDEEILRRLMDMGVNFIETLRPDVAFALLPVPEDEAQLSI